jgi:hypothetical protein
LKRSKELECAENWHTGECPLHQGRTLRTSHSREFQGALHYNSPDCLVCHRTVRYVSGQRLSSANGRLCKVLQWLQCRGRSQRAPDCLVPQEDKAPTVDRAPNPNDWVTWRRTGQGTVHVRWRTGLSGAPIASSLPNGYQSGWGAINTPNHHNLWHPSIPNISFNKRAKDSTPRHIK